MTEPATLTESLKQYAEAVPEAERPDALHQLFYGFYSRIAILDRTTHELARWAKSDIAKIPGVEPVAAEALRDNALHVGRDLFAARMRTMSAMKLVSDQLAALCSADDHPPFTLRRAVAFDESTASCAPTTSPRPASTRTCRTTPSRTTPTPRPPDRLPSSNDERPAVASLSGGAPARNRTWNLRIKSPLLCQLSYKGARSRMLAPVSARASGVGVGRRLPGALLLDLLGERLLLGGVELALERVALVLGRELERAAAGEVALAVSGRPGRRRSRGWRTCVSLGRASVMISCALAASAGPVEARRVERARPSGRATRSSGFLGSSARYLSQASAACASFALPASV